jgi:isopenicillin-N epimerase
LPLDLDALQCDYYAASCHKWLCGPFGSGFLHVRKDRRDWISPPIKSWGKPFPNTQPSWRDEYEWFGTHDPSSMIGVAAAIDFFTEYGFDEFRQQSHANAQYARQQISQLTGLTPLTPDDPSWYGVMVAVPLPPGECVDLQRRLLENHRLEIPVIDWNGQRLIRVSCPLYIGREAIDLLVTALRAEL